MSRRPPARLVLAASALAGVLLAGCGEVLDTPDPVTEQGSAVDRLMQPVALAAVAVAALIWVAVAVSVIRYRKRNDAIPTQVAEHIPVEIVYTVVPILIVAVLFVVGIGATREVEELSDDPDVTVDVEGFQWSWQFTYPEQDVLVSGTGAGVEGPELVLPVDRTTRLRLVSNDVAHSFWVPDFLHKRDLIPGVDNEIDVTPTEEGTYTGKCAEYCGLDHWRMNFRVRVVSADEFAAWAEENGGDDVTPAADDPADTGEGGR